MAEAASLHEHIHRRLRDDLHCVAIPIRDAHENMEILDQPQQFFDALCSGISSARARIVLASLYLGTGDHERKLVQLIDQQMGAHEHLQLDVLLDCLRATRGGVSGPDALSSCTVLQPLLHKYGPDRVRIRLYHTPNLNGLWKRVLPERVNEVVGVQHIKAYIFDDDLLITGANLSDWYFVDRQDRYMAIRNQSAVADFFHGLVDVVGDCSYSLDALGNLVLRGGGSSGGNSGTPFDPVHQNVEYRVDARHRMEDFLREARQKYDVEDMSVSDTWVFPSVQAAPMGIRHDEGVTSAMLRMASLVSEDRGTRLTKLYLSSAYFNITQMYTDSIVNALQGSMRNVDVDHDGIIEIVTSSPQCNGFYTATDRFSRQIPFMYSLMEKRFFDFVNDHVMPPGRRGQDPPAAPPIRLLEYVREGWTFHAKGLWLYDRATNQPVATMIGSPNFGHRSVERDIEAQIVVLTRNRALQQKLDHERAYLFEPTVPVVREMFHTTERKAGYLFSMMTRFMQRFL